MRIAFAGTGTFAAPILAALAETGAEIVRVITRPDRPQGRGRAPAPVPVALEAGQRGLEILRVERIGAHEEELRGLGIDVLLVADFGELIPDRILALPRIGPFNVHGSLLPRWRGAAPVAHAIRAGDRETGVTIFRMVKGLDAGPILCRRALPISPDDTAATLEDRLAVEASHLAREALELLATGAFTLREQDPALVTFAPKLTKEEGRVEWSAAAEAIERHIRAMQPWPRAYSFLRAAGREPQRLTILRARVVDAPGAGRAASGTVTAVTPCSIEVACGSGALAILGLQPENRRAMTAEDFLRGTRVLPGDPFTC